MTKISSEEEFFMLRPSLFQFKKQEGENVDLKRSVRTLENILGRFERRL